MEFKNRGALGSFYFFAGFIGLAAGMSPVALADDAVFSDIGRIDEVIVTASLLNKSDVGTSGNTRVLSGKEVADGASEGLGAVLDNLLGVSVTDFGSAVSRPTIRGLTGDRVKVLNNTVRARDVSGLGADHSMDVDLFNVEQIEVIKGPASLLYTNGAIGGIVNVVDNAIASENFRSTETTLGLETQSVNNGQVEFFAHQGSVAGFNFTASFKNSEFENYEVPEGAILESEHGHGLHHDDEHANESSKLANSDFSKETWRAGLSKVGDWGYVGVSYASNEGLYGVPFHVEEHTKENSSIKLDDHDGHDDKRSAHNGHEEERIFALTESDIISLEGAFTVNRGLLNSISYHFRDTDYALVEGHAEQPGTLHAGAAHGGHHTHAGPTVFTNDAQEFGAVFDFSGDVLTQKVSLFLVSEDQSIIGAEAFMNPVESDELSLGYYISQPFGEFVVDFGVRADWVERRGSVSHAEGHEHDKDHKDDHDKDGPHDNELQIVKADETVSSFGLQVARRINEQLTTTLNLSSVEKAPAAVELFMNGAHLATGRYEVGNPTLKTERAKGAEFTIEYVSQTMFGFLTLYENQIDNYVYLHDESAQEHADHRAKYGHDHAGLILAHYVQADAEFTGYEFEIGRAFQVAAGNLTLSYGVDAVSAKFADNSYVPRINPDRTVYKAIYDKDGFDAAIVLKDVDSQRDIAGSEDLTHGYSMLDVRASNQFTLADDMALTVSVFGTNLLDEAARNHASFVKNEVPLPGRSYGLKFYATF